MTDNAGTIVASSSGALMAHTTFTPQLMVTQSQKESPQRKKQEQSSMKNAGTKPLPQATSESISSTTNRTGQNMRTKTTLTQLQKEVTALDMAVRHLRQQVTSQTQTIITLKKALNAPLTATEQEIFDAQPVEIQTTINQSANLIASATRTTNAQSVVNYTITTPASRTRTKSAQPLSQTRWTPKEEQIMRKMLKEGKSMKQVSQALQRSVKACDLHWRIMNKKKGK